MHASDYEAVIYDGGIYCLNCVPRGVYIDDCEPILAIEEWDEIPTCIYCGKEHDYVIIIEPEDEEEEKKNK